MVKPLETGTEPERQVDGGAAPDGDRRGPGGPGHSHFGKAQAAEDPGVVKHDVQQRRKDVDDHHRPHVAAAGEERTERRANDHEAFAPAHGLVIVGFQPGDACRMANRRKEPGGERNGGHRQRHAGKTHEQRLPDYRTDALRPLGAVVLSDKRVDVARRAEGKADHQKGHHPRRQGRRDRIGRVPDQEHPVGKDHQGPRQGGNDERQRQLEHVPHAGRPAPPGFDELPHAGTIAVEGRPQTVDGDGSRSFSAECRQAALPTSGPQRSSAPVKSYEEHHSRRKVRARAAALVFQGELVRMRGAKEKNGSVTL